MKRTVIRKHYATEIMDISLLLLSVWWLIILFSPLGTFEESTYHLIDSYGGLLVWRIVTILMILIYTAALLLNNYALKAIAAIATIGASIFMVVAVFHLEPRSSAIGPYVIFLVIAFWRYINIMQMKR